MTAASSQTSDTVPQTASRVPVRRGELGLALQEVLTVVCRLRSGRTVGGDGEVFRESVRLWLAGAAQRCDQLGYSEEFIVLAGYAVTAFLDESVLNSSDPMFSEWHRRPLQEEIFGEFLGGERFFQNLDELQRQPDSEDLADLLEVHLLCLGLGFQGQYGAMGPGGRHELQTYWDRTRDRVLGIRGAWGDLSPTWSIPPYYQSSPGLDRTTRWLLGGAAAAVIFVGVLWTSFYFIAHSLN